MTRKPEVGRLQPAVAMSSLTILELAGTSGPTTGASFSILKLERPHSIRRLLVSAFLADSIQHIHSLRASGVISSHAVHACGSDVSAFLKSAGTSCTTPLEIFLCGIDKLSFRKAQSREDLLLSKECGSFGHIASPVEASFCLYSRSLPLPSLAKLTRILLNARMRREISLRLSANGNHLPRKAMRNPISGWASCTTRVRADVRSQALRPGSGNGRPVTVQSAITFNRQFRDKTTRHM
jgi:hypothetical protein